jgi:hypothetical protein
LRHEPGEAVDDFARRAGIRLIAGLGRLPEGFGGLDGGGIDTPRDGNAAIVVAAVFDRDLAQGDVPDAAGLQPIGQRNRRLAVSEGRDKRPNLVARQAAGERDFLDLALLERAGEAEQRGRRLPSTTTASPMKPTMTVGDA